MESQSNKKYLKYVAGLILLILVVSAVGYFVYKNVIPAFFSQKNVSKIDLSSAPVTFVGTPLLEAPFDFKGTLYLSSLKTDNQNNLGIYSFNIDGTVGSGWSTVLADKTSNDGNYYVNVSPSVSADGKTLVFAREKTSDLSFQIFTSDLSGKNLHQITNLPDKTKVGPVFGPSGKLVAYISRNDLLPADNIDIEIPENWLTYLTDLNGNAVKVAAGVNPIFSPDGGKLLVLQNNGLHLYDISVWTKPKHLGLVLPVSGGAFYSMKIGVPADGTMIAWSTPGSGTIGSSTIVVSRINSWDVFNISPFLTINTNAYAYWPVFSPDGKYLAMDELRKDTAGNEYPVIMGYDLSNGKSKPIVALTSDNKNYVWLGAWK